MAEGLGVAASVMTVLQLTQSVIKYIANIKDAPNECRKLLVDFTYIEGLLEILKDTTQDADSVAEWDQTIHVLKSSSSPIETLKIMLEPFVTKLQEEASKTGIQRMVSSLLWPLTKKKTEEMATAIERQKLLLDIVISNDHVRLSTEIKRDTSKLIENFKTMQTGLDNVTLSVVDIQKSQNTNDVIDTLTWLSPLQYQSTQSDTYKQSLDGSLMWFLQSPEFQSWILGQQSTLLYVGKLGAGKTVLAATAIHHLQDRFLDRLQEVGIAWLYCNFQERVSQTPTNVLGSIVRQLVSRRQDLLEAAISLRNQKLSPEATFDDIKLLLTKCKDTYNKTYLVIDALDMYSEDSLGWTGVISELQGFGDRFKILCTSRPIAAIENYFSSASRVKVEAQESDVRAYVQSLLNQPEFQKHLKNEEQLRVHIEDTLIKKADGMFLLVTLHMDALRRAATFNKLALRNAVDQLPKKLEQTYGQALDRIKMQAEEDAELAGQVLSWLYLSYSALTVRTLQQAIAKQQNLDPADDESLIDGEKLASVCAGLVTINEDSQIVGFVHFTLAEYLNTRFDNLYPGNRRLIDYCCFHHVMWTDHLSTIMYNETIVSPFQSLQDRDHHRKERKHQYQSLPFWNYALFHMQRLEIRRQIGEVEMYRKWPKPVDVPPDAVEAFEFTETLFLLLRHYEKVKDYTKSLGQDLIFAVFAQDENECKAILGNPCITQSQSMLSACLAYSVCMSTNAIVGLFLDTNASIGAWHKMDMMGITKEPFNVFKKEYGLSCTPLGFAVLIRLKSKIKQILDREADLVNLPAIKYHTAGPNLHVIQTPLQIALDTTSTHWSNQEHAEWLEIAQLLRSYGATESVAR